MKFQETIMKSGAKRNDRWGTEVIDRISKISSLIDESALYHQTCSIYFRNLKIPVSSKFRKQNIDKFVEKRAEYVDRHEVFLKHIVHILKISGSNKQP